MLPLKKKIFWILLAALTCAPLLTFAAAPPSILSYQGRLANSSGDLLGGSGTAYYFKFSIWNNATVGSGTRLWPASAPTATTATVRQGVFTVNIGDTANGYPDPLSLDFSNYSALYLQVEVSSNGSSYETLSPRQRITSSAYAQLAGGVVGTTTQSAFGTTTPYSDSLVTVAATSSSQSLLSIIAAATHTAPLLQILNNSFQNLFSITSSGAIMSSSTATSTLSGGLFANSLRVTSLASCDTIDTDANGYLVCGTDQTSAGAANPFTWPLDYGVTTAATSSALWAQSGLFASSTSHFVNADFTTATTTNLAVSASTTINTLNLTNALAVAQGGTGARTLNDLITLGTHTTGNYLATLANASSGGLTVTGSGSETAAVTIGLDLANTNSWTARQQFALASTTGLSALGTLYAGSGTATTTISASAINIPTGGAYQINGAAVLNGTTLGSGVTASSLTSVGTLTSLTVSGQTSLQNASTTNFSANTLAVGGTGTTTVSATGALFAPSATFGAALPVASGGTGATSLNDLITLGTHTTGNYLATLADSGAGSLTISGSGSETAAVTAAINLANANNWTGLQRFVNASTTNISAYTAAFGGSATTTIDSAGNLAVAGNFTGAGLSSCNGSTQKLLWTGGQFSCGTDQNTGGGGGSFPFSADTNYGQTVYSTSTPTLWFQSGVFASSTSHFVNADFTTATTTNLAVSASTTINTLNLTNALAVAQGGTGARTLNDLITLGTHTTGNYLATLADSGAGSLTISGSGSETAAVTAAINLANANDWTGLQRFVNASTTNFSALTKASFGSSATSSFSSAGVLTLGSITGSTQCLHVDSSGTVTGTGSDCSSGGAAFPFTPATNYGALANATSTAIWFQSGLQASSTSYFVKANFIEATTTSFAALGSTTISGQFNALGGATLGASAASSLTLSTALPILSGGTGATSLNDLITLGTHTTGNYVATLADSNSTLTIANSGSETAAVTATLNLAHANSWSALQQFANATSSLFSVTGKAYFGTSATTTIDSAGNVAVAGNFTGAGLSTCASGADKLLWTGGQFSCGTDAGSAGTDYNLTFFNGSGVRLATTSNQVLFGATATSSALVPLAAFNVIGGAGIDNATTTTFFATTASSTNTTVGNNAIIYGSLGVGSTTPGSKFSLSGGNFTLNATNTPVLATTTTTTANTYASVVAGRYVYVADGGAGLRIFDNTNPYGIYLAGSYTGISGAVSVAVAGKYAYVGDTSAGLVIIDVSNPATPVLVGSLSTAGDAYGLVVSGKYVYASNFTAGKVGIIDVSDPTAPKLISQLTTGGSPYGLVVQGKYLYIANQGAPRFQIADISNAIAPVLLGSYTGGTFPTGIYVSGRYAYVADASKGLYVVDIKNPLSPTLKGSFDTSGAYYGVTVAGNYAYIADHAGRVRVIDVSDPTNLRPVGSYTIGAGSPFGISMSGKFLYVADDDQGLKVIDINGIQAPAANIGAIETNTINVSDNAAIGGDLSLGGGLSAGISGIFSRGTISAFIASTTQTNPTVANFMGGNVGVGTSTPGQALSVEGKSLLGNSATAGFFTATTTTASNFPYASTTALSASGNLNVTGTGFFATASTTNLTVSALLTNRVPYITTAGAFTSSANLTFDGTTLTANALTLSNALPVASGGTGATSLNDLITLGTHTTGNYLATLANASSGGLTVTGSGSETAAVTIGLDLANTNSWTARQQFALASTTGLSALGTLYAGSGTATTTISASAINIPTGGAYQINGAAVLNGTTLGSGVTASSLTSVGTLTSLTVSGNTSLANATSTAFFSSSLMANVAAFGQTATSTFTSSGFLGISSSTPWAQLSVNPIAANNAAPSFVVGSSTATAFIVDNAGRVGIGTTSPWHILSVNSDGTSLGQFSLSSDNADYTDFRTDTTGNLWLLPTGSSGGAVNLITANLFVCAGTSISSKSCPSGTPTNKGTIVAESAIGIATSTPQWNLEVAGTRPSIAISDTGAGGANLKHWLFTSEGGNLYIGTSTDLYATTTPAISVIGGTGASSGYVGVGTSSPAQQFAINDRLFVGARGQTTLGLATSTFYGDIKIAGKLDVATIDPVYTIDGIKYATYGQSAVGVHEEVMQTIELSQKGASGKYEYTISFNSLEKGSDVWLFYQITDFGTNWKDLVVALTPAFDGSVHYEKDAAHNTLKIVSSQPGEVSMRLSALRFDNAKWPNLRPDQEDKSYPGFEINAKASISP